MLLRLLLVLALVWLPMGNLMAGVSVSTNAVHVMEDSVDAHHHQHQLSQETDSVKTASAYTLAENTVQDHAIPKSCAGHLAPCCSACISFCVPSALVLVPFSLFEVDRYQRYSVPISVIVLPRDIRPPIV